MLSKRLLLMPLILGIALGLLVGYGSIARSEQNLDVGFGYTLSGNGGLRGDLGPVFIEVNSQDYISNCGLEIEFSDNFNTGAYLEFNSHQGSLQPRYGSVVGSIAPFIGLQGDFNFVTVKTQLGLPIGRLQTGNPLLRSMEPRLSLSFDLFQLLNGNSSGK